MKKNEALKLCRRYMQERPEEWDKIMNELGFSRTPSQPLDFKKVKIWVKEWMPMVNSDTYAKAIVEAHRK